MNKYLFTLTLSLLSIKTIAQFPGKAGSPGSTAIHKDSSIFVAWATGCTVNRGPQDISNPGLGLASSGDSTLALGTADNTTISLGDGGYAILSFEHPVSNGPGFDFAVFENAFHDAFLELAFVEVSSNGINFTRFPATYNSQTTIQMSAFDTTGDASQLNNLAGKYRAQYGTPFDLSELEDTPGLDINAITHIKVIDAIGSIDALYATYDQNSNPINDPFPTPFPSGGFDLDAVGVIHQQPTEIRPVGHGGNSMSIFPNPLPQGHILYIDSKEKIQTIVVYHLNGRSSFKGSLQEFNELVWNKGFYFIQIHTEQNRYQSKLVVQ